MSVSAVAIEARRVGWLRPRGGLVRGAAAALALATGLGLQAPARADALAPLTANPGSFGPAERSGAAAGWFYAGLPNQTLPATRFSVEEQDGRRVLRVEAAASYGNLLHRLSAARAGELSWRWRVERPLQAADLRTRQGDDVALKVCALFDMPRENVPFVERQLLRLAESRTGEALPNATLCYAFDPSFPEGTVVPNAFSRRVRYVTLGTPGKGWQNVRRDLAADFLRAFGDEARTAPPLLAVAVGADADNTQGSSVGFVADLELRPRP